MRKLHVLGLLLAGVMLLAGACAPKAAPPTPTPTQPSPSQATTPAPAASQGEWDKILAAAKKEGSVTVYSTSAAQLKAASSEAMQKLGIKVETIGGSGNELQARILTEGRAKANVADLHTGGLTNQLGVAEAGFGEALTVALPAMADKGVFKRDVGQYDATKSTYIYGNGITPSIIVNTDLVKPGEITSWNDLLDPKWRDKMVMSDPRAGGGPGPSGLWAWMKLGEDFWKKMASQRPSLQVSPELPVQQVALGEKAIAIFPNYLRIVNAIKAGAPVKIVHLKEGTSYYVTAVQLVKNAPHPNAALVFLNWMFSKEGQEAIGKSAGVFTVRKDVKDDWVPVPELIAGTFTLLEPPNNVDLQGPRKANAFAKSVFGEP